MVEPVFVVPHDLRWPSLFALERSRVEAAVGPWVEAVEHVGSTAVPGLDAKPVIDLMAGVRDVRSAVRCIRPLEEIGYSYWAENPNPDRMLFVRFVDAGRNSVSQPARRGGLGRPLERQVRVPGSPPLAPGGGQGIRAPQTRARRTISRRSRGVHQSKY